MLENSRAWRGREVWFLGQARFEKVLGPRNGIVDECGPEKTLAPQALGLDEMAKKQLRSIGCVKNEATGCPAESSPSNQF